MLQNQGNFNVSLLIFVKNPEVRRTLETNLSALTSPQQNTSLSRDHYNFSPHFVADDASLARKVIELLYLNSRPTPLILLSDVLLQSPGISAADQLHFQPAAELVHNAFLANSIPDAAIALGNMPGELPAGLVAQVTTAPLSLPDLREALGRAALRLHLLMPAHLSSQPKLFPEGLDPDRFTFQLAQTPEELLSCFELRYSIYDVMGYLPKEVQTSGLGMEMDFHDGLSLHFLAKDQKTQEVAATLRLVLPHQPWGVCASVAPHLREAFQSQQQWFRRLAEVMQAPALQRKLLDASPGPLPMLHNARVNTEWREFLARGLSGVEISRVVVPPKYRGVGLSRVLMHMVLSAAFEMGRKMVFAECFPSHVPMYHSYGFCDIEGREATAGNWGSIAYTPQALLLEMAKGNSQPVQTARWDSALFKMANAEIQAPAPMPAAEVVTPSKKVTVNE